MASRVYPVDSSPNAGFGLTVYIGALPVSAQTVLRNVAGQETWAGGALLRVGIYLQRSCFPHGYLCFDLSR